MKVVLAMGSHLGFCDVIKNQKYPFRLISYHYQKRLSKEDIIERFCTNKKSGECVGLPEARAE